MYAGARIARTESDWITGNTSIDSEIHSSLGKLRDRSRQLCRDNDHVQAIQRTITNNVVGQGIKCQSQVRMKRGGNLNKALNDQIETAWYRWTRRENCHTAGKLCFEEIQRVVMSSVFESGEVLLRLIPQAMGRSKVPLSIEVIESDYLDETYNDIAPGSKNEIRMGVEYNQWKRPVAYWFRPAHPGDQPLMNASIRSNERKRVPANEVLHLFITKRPGQTRGVPWIHSTMLALNHLHGYQEAEVVAARATACVMGFIESPELEAPADGIDNGDKVIDMASGKFEFLAPGEKMNPMVPTRPGGQFEPFVRMMLRTVASGNGVAYESVSGDYSQSNYSSSRLALVEIRDNWRVLQAWLISAMMQPIYERWLSLAVLAGEVKISDFEVNEDAYIYPRWMPRGWSWVDPAKEVAADLSAVRAGFKTLSEVVSEHGGDFEELVTQRAREIEITNEAGLVLDSDPEKVDGKGAEQADPAAEPAVAQ
jgi:lambda family phage portal protein